MTKQIPSTLFAALALATLAGCGGGGAGGAGGTGSGGGPITSAQRAASLSALTTYYGTLPHTDPASDSQAVAAFLKARPEIEASGVTQDDTAWARFTDGRLLLFVNDRYVGPATLKSVPVPARAPTTRAIPASKKAYSVRAFGAGYQDSASLVAGQLLSKGYNVTAGAVTVSTLKQVKEAGVFYIETHGGNGPRRDGADVYALGTSEPVSNEGEEAYKEDLDTGRLVYMICPWHIDAQGNGPAEAHYGFTKAFIAAYMDLTPNCLVFINACSSYNQAMLDAFEIKGATSYLGWTRPTVDADAANAGKYFFDRVLGTNLSDPRLDPPQRPFDIPSIYGEMVNLSLDRSLPPRQIVSRLKWTPLGGDTVVDLLAPTIIRLQPEEEKDTLHIVGSFGPDPGSDGKVTVDGTELKVRSWQKDQIACDLPRNADDAGGSSGPVVVEVRGHKSNHVELTSWRPTFKLTFHGLGTMHYTVTIHAHVRIDAHDYRFVPSETPRQGEWPFTLAKDSTCIISAGGSYTEPQTGARFVMDLSGSDQVPLNGDIDRTFDGVGSVKTNVPGAERLMRMQLHANAKDALRTTAYLPDGTTMVSYDELRCDTASMGSGTDASIPIALTDTYGIIGDIYTFGPLDLEFDNAPAVNPPDPKAARGAERAKHRRRR